MKGAKNLEMVPGQDCEDNIYANTSDFNVQRMRNSPKANGIPAAKNTQHLVILTLGVLLILAFLTVVILTSFLFIYYKTISEEMTQMKKNDSNPKPNLTDQVIASLSSDIQRILGVLGKVTEDFQKTKSSPGPLCNEGWTWYGLSCYYVSSNSQQWNASKKDCEGQKAHLVVINGVGEMNFLQKISKSKSMWIGLTKVDGTWRWVDGTPYDVTPKFWAQNQPDDWTGHGFEGGEECSELRSGREWNDRHCAHNVSYICEKKIFW